MIASGTLNAKLNTPAKEWKSYFHKNIQKMFSVSRVAVIFNCMTEFVNYRYDRLYYPTMEELSQLAVKELSSRLYHRSFIPFV